MFSPSVNLHQYKAFVENEQRLNLRSKYWQAPYQSLKPSQILSGSALMCPDPYFLDVLGLTKEELMKRSTHHHSSMEERIAAFNYLIEGKTVKQTAELCGVGESTNKNWKRTYQLRGVRKSATALTKEQWE